MPNHPERDSLHARVLAAAAPLVSSLPPGEAAAFLTFVRAVLAQTRTVTFASIEPEAAARDLLDTWQFLGRASTDGVNVLAHATEGGVTVLSAMADQPFIVDTIRKGLRQAGSNTMSGFNVVLRVDRSNGLRLAGDGEGRAESVVRLTANGVEGEQAGELATDIRGRLTVAQATAADFEAMIARVEATADAVFDVSGEEGIEAAEFLRWLLSDNFVFVGVTAFVGDAVERMGADRLAPSAMWPSVEACEPGGIVRVRKGGVESPIHRNGRIDIVRVFLPGSQVVIRGMFTHRALTQACRHLPILRRTLANVLAETRQRPNSYRYKGLANIFDAMPTEWLFSASPDEIREVIELVFDADQEQRARVHVTQPDGGETTFTLISLPGRRYSESIRAELQGFLTDLTGANYTDSSLFAGRFDSVLLQVYQTGTRPLSEADVQLLETHLANIATSWAERISVAVTQQYGEDASVLLARYGEAFSTEYRDHTTAELCATDLRYLEDSRRTGHTLAHLCRVDGEVQIRVYQSAEIALSGLLPIIDNFGVTVSDQIAFEVKPRGRSPQYLDVFRIANVPGIDQATLLERGARLVAGLEAVFQRHMASDPYNRLVLRAGLSWQEVDLVRAYIGYARQIGLKQSIPRAQDILLAQSTSVAAIVGWFRTRFDPDLTGDRKALAAAAREAVDDALRQIRTNDEDVVMRKLANLVDATVRTNFFRTDRVAHYISFKLEHARIQHMPLPRMMCEIYVHHREVEGVHLRGGKVARGGLRFSDRADYRTEVLGLVTTQMVKNVVIVPEGSKGGFYITYTIDDPKERRRKGDELYEVFIRGLLDVTDNIVDGQVVHPPRVVQHDGDDPYLVVAADKGTAHLSDTANKLSLAYGFWLGDAFASGGSNGYDHKKVGITARGGWVLVKRHFREMGMDADVDPFTCAGVGDCGGDVFGNGVIETKAMRLQAAFNHLHIFLDPNPDAATSFIERRRLFDGVMGWDQYNTALISAGGGVFDRRAKSIALSAEVKAMLGTLEDELTPDQVVNLILKMPVDLLWNGGIGTYVRASYETDADANDPSNDAVRVTATELRCKIIGEGGNLGLTQQARIEYALHGGRLNTDFVDNSGGVDTSDHEVNLKILLNPMVAAGRITMDERNTFIHSMTDEVADMVLANNHANGRLISLDAVRSVRDPNAFARTIDWICARGNVTRAFLSLPTDDELKRRAAARKGLTRPEIATIQAHVKMHLFKMLMQEEEAQIPAFNRLLTNYFPTAVRERYAADIPGHMLRKSIGMTVTLTEIATDAGSCFFPMMMDLTGASPARIAGAWLEAMRLVGGEELRDALAEAKARPETAYQGWTAFTAGVEQLVASWLTPGNSGFASEDQGRLRAAIEALWANRSSADQKLTATLVNTVTGKGIPESLAERLVAASHLPFASEVAAAAAVRNEPITRAAVRYLAVGQASGLLNAARGENVRRSDGRWDPVARGILRLRYQVLLREVVAKVDVTDAQLSLGVDSCAAALASGPLADVARVVEQILGDTADVPALLVAEQQIRAVL